MWRSRIEVPQFTKCCFCVPLRYGLLAVAYTKLALTTFLAVLLTVLITIEVQNFRARSEPVMYFLAPSLLVLATYVDIGFTTAFVVAGHMKQRRGILIYYYYSLTVTVIYVVLSISSTIITITYGYKYFYKHIWINIGQDVLLILSVTLVQSYWLLLLRSELLKLINSTNFRFVNNMSERAAAVDKSDEDAILREEREGTESRIEDIGLE